MSKVIMITGGGSGMGQLAARNFAGRGWKVAALDINQVGLAETRKGHEASIDCMTVDITDTQAVNAAVADIEARLGPGIADRCLLCHQGGGCDLFRSIAPRESQQRRACLLRVSSHRQHPAVKAGQGHGVAQNARKPGGADRTAGGARQDRGGRRQAGIRDLPWQADTPWHDDAASVSSTDLETGASGRGLVEVDSIGGQAAIQYSD